MLKNAVGTAVQQALQQAMLCAHTCISMSATGPTQYHLCCHALQGVGLAEGRKGEFCIFESCLIFFECFLKVLGAQQEASCCHGS
jgi:hypothetical protein